MSVTSVGRGVRVGVGCKFLPYILQSRGKRRIPGIRNLWEYNENPKNPASTKGIPGVQWESQEYDGNPGSTMGIPGVRWKSREYDGNPGSTMGIPRVRWKSRDYDGNPGSTQSVVSPLLLCRLTIKNGLIYFWVSVRSN